MISYYLPSGSKIGVGHQVHALANEFARRGHAVTVFSGCGASDGALYSTVQVPLVGANRTFRFAWALRDVNWMDFDVLHAHGDDSWLDRRPRPFHVRTLHGSCFAEMRWISGARERLRMGLLGASEVKASLTADVTVRVSVATFRWLPWLGETIPNGVDTERFRPGSKSSHPTILFVGTFTHRKRGWLLAEAFQQHVRHAFPDAELWMVCESAPAGPGVTVLGRVDDEVLADLMRRAWVFCLPSTYEGFGIPYVEAMASGTPVVATPNPGALEVLQRGRLGAIVADEHLGPALVDLLSSPGRRDRMAEIGVKAASRFDIAAVANRYESIYRFAPVRHRRRPRIAA